MKITNPYDFEIHADSKLLEFLSERSVCATRASAYLYLVAHRVNEITTLTRNSRTCTALPGQTVMPVTQLVIDWKWDRKTVQRYLDKMVELGYLQFHNYLYWTIFDFPRIEDRPTPEKLEQESLLSSDGNPRIDLNGKSKYEPCGKGQCPEPDEIPSSKMNPVYPDIRYNAPPLSLDEDTSSQCKQIYEYLIERLPRLEIPSYNDRTEKAIYFLFVLGMKKDISLMTRYLDIVAEDPYKNGEIAEMTGNSSDQESFESLFSCKWQELLFGVQP